MRVVRSVELAAPAAVVFNHVDDLDRYPPWMALVHAVERVDADGAVWNVELRANVGPLARSKRLRMRRSVHDIPSLVEFERDEDDGRNHSAWVLRAEVTERGHDASLLVMTLSYGGSLWTGAVLQRVLDEHVERGATALQRLVG